MTVVWWLGGALILLFWADRLRDAAEGMPSVADLAEPRWDRQLRPAPRVAIVVPARNEEPSVERCLHSLLALEYPNYEIIAVDDRSDDGTGGILDAIAHDHRARLRVMHVRDLPAGWLGKPHAMWAASQEVKDAEWLLFTDADVVFRPDTLRRAIAYAENESADHLVLFPAYQVRGAGEKIMMAGFHMLFVLGHRPWKVANPQADDFMGLGPFNLIRWSAYRRIGGFERLRMEVIEDMKLGKLVKQHGLRQRNAFGRNLLPWRWGTGAVGISRNLTKNLYALMQFRWPKALGACALLLIFNFFPLVGIALAPGWAKAPYGMALACIAALHYGMGRRTTVPAWTFLLYPVSTALIVFTMLRSIAHVARHGGVVWRGTRYDVEELRRGMV